MYNQHKLSSQVWIGKGKEHRKSYRRKTIAPVSLMDQSKSREKQESHALDLSLDGAFIQNGEIPPVGSHVNIKIDLPSGKGTTLKIGGRVIRTEDSGFGVQFNDLHYKDRSRIRSYVGFSELDQTVVSIQNTMKDILSGNMLPVTEPDVIEDRLETARKKELDCLILDSKRAKICSAKLDFNEDGIVLKALDKKIPAKIKVIYVIIIDGPLHTIFEGLIYDAGQCPKLFHPERIYLNDRRWSRRLPAEQEQMILSAPHMSCHQFCFSVVDKSEGGCSILAPKSCLYTEGMRLPAFQFKKKDGLESYDGATISRMTDIDGENWLLGLQYIDNIQSRDTFSEVSKKTLKSSFFDSVMRVSSLAVQRIKGVVTTGKKDTPHGDRPCLVRYKNTRGETVAALMDATFDLHSDPPAVDVAVVISPPFPVRKEVFSLLARTLIDNFKHQGKNAVVLRFDLTQCLGESEVNPEMDAKGHPYLNWNYSALVSDISGSLSFLEKRYMPGKRALISYSVSAIASRHLIANKHFPRVDHWVAPFGCPDGQDMLKNLLAGVDLFDAYQRGEAVEPFLIYGRLFDPRGSIPDAIENNMAFLEDARNDMSKIKIPVTWLVGTYDYMVTRTRVREMLNAPGGGVREIIELPTGHNPRTGGEGIESFKLIVESISKHLFNDSICAVEPDLARHKQQNQMEWARSRKNKISNMEKFWEDHLFGTSSEKEGYDVLLYNPDYVDFINKHVELIDLRPNLRVADFGCGTGNFSAAMLEQFNHPGETFQLSCYDLVGAAIEKTKRKLENILDGLPEANLFTVEMTFKTLDLERARLLSVKELLEGRLYGIKALQGRIEGLNASTLKKIDADYNQEIHDVIHGKEIAIKTFQKLCPEMEGSELEEILDLSRAVRFIKNKLSAEDTVSQGTCTSAKDLKLKHLFFGDAAGNARIDCPSNSFDRIGTSLVIPYLFDPESVIKEFYRILDDNGVLVISSLKPNADNSKSCFEEAQAIAERDDLNDKERERLLDSLREFTAFLSRLVELEDEGRFRFFTVDALRSLLEKAGFKNISFIESLGNPSSAVIMRAEKL